MQPAVLDTPAGLDHAQLWDGSSPAAHAAVVAHLRSHDDALRLATSILDELDRGRNALDG
jgi:hypothetical protein